MGVAGWPVILTGWPVTGDGERYRCACAGRGDGISASSTGGVLVKIDMQSSNVMKA